MSGAGCASPVGPDVVRVDATADTVPPTDVSADASRDVGRIAHPCQRFRAGADASAADATGIEAGASDASASDAADTLACNGSPTLCDRRYDQVSFPTAHNAMSNSDEMFYLPNQHHGMARALADGVRGFMIDTHYCNGEPSLAHSQCWLGHKPLSVGLCEVTQFLDTHPDEIVTLQIESYVSDVDTVAAFVESGSSDYVRFQPVGTTFPTLRQMIADDLRLMVFVESGGGTPNWLMPLFQYSFDTPYSFATVSDFTCTINRGVATNPLFTLNHWLQNPASDPMWAQLANVNPVLVDRVRRCMADTGHLPNFVAVDFYDIGDVMSTVAMANGL